MPKRLLSTTFTFLMLLTILSGARAAGIFPARLRCDYRVDPLGIDSAPPRLDWILQAASPSVRGVRQSAYQIRVASSPALLAKDRGDLWDTGKTGGDRTSQVAYAGHPLHAAERCWWKVRVWDQAGAPSAWSAPAQWTMGLLTPTDWQGAAWIGAATGTDAKTDSLLLRRSFDVKPRLTRALVFVCGLGQYEMTVNGRKVGRDVLSPGWTKYDKTCLYDTYDATALLKPGANDVGLFLGNGMYNVHPGRFTKITGSFGPQKAICLLRLQYADGTTQNVVSDGRWQAHPGPITFSSIYGGEDYDARLWPDGSGWAAPTVTTGPGGTLKGLSAAGPPVRSFGVLTPVHTQTLNPTTTVYDLGQNASLMLRLRVRGAAGSSVKITPSELVGDNGDINDTMCGGDSYWLYTLNGQGEETYLSRFYYRGGRYLKVEVKPAPGETALPIVEAVAGDVIRADAPSVGQFACSNERFNKVFSLIRWAQMNNMVSIMTDCPTREKLGWLEEDHLNGPALRYNFDMSTMMTKMVGDMTDSQRPNGLVPSTCPDFPHWDAKGMYYEPARMGQCLHRRAVAAVSV